MGAEITEHCGPQQSIAESVGGNVGVGGADQAAGLVDDDPAQQQRRAPAERVDIEPKAGSHCPEAN